MKNDFYVTQSLIPTSILAHSLKCWTCQPDGGKNCFDISNNIQLTCEGDNDSCATVIVDSYLYRSKFQSQVLYSNCNGWIKLTKDSVKYNLNTSNFSEATRGCAGVKKNDGCKDSGNAKVCYCNDDMCNSYGFGNENCLFRRNTKKIVSSSEKVLYITCYMILPITLKFILCIYRRPCASNTKCFSPCK